MRRISGLLVAGLSLALFGACEQQQDVSGQVEDLREAREGTDAEAQRLQNELDEAKKEVAELERQLALAREGVTDDVLQERQELQESLQEQREEVKGEVDEAQQEAERHRQESEAARQELEDTAPPKDVKTKVESEAEVVPGEQGVQQEKEQRQIEIERTEVEGVEQEEQRLQREQQHQQGQQPPPEQHQQPPAGQQGQPPAR
jgi:colicin import membrane protein